jgi:hypothetical protein
VPDSAAFAARLISFEIYRDEEMIMQAHAADSGRESDAVVWTYLETTKWEPVDDFQPAVFEDNPRHALLDGQIRIRALHGKDLLAAVEVEGLVLVRSSPDAEDWRLTLEEVNRTGHVAGLFDESGTSSAEDAFVAFRPDGFFIGLICIAGFLVGGLLLIVVFLAQIRRRTETRQ